MLNGNSNLSPVGRVEQSVTPIYVKGKSKKEVKFTDSLDPATYLDHKAQKAAHRVFRKTLSLERIEVGIKTLEHFAKILKKKDLTATDQTALIKNANKICAFLIKNESFTSEQFKRIQTLSSQNPHLKELETLLEWAKIQKSINTRSELDPIKLEEKKQLKTIINTVNKIIDQYHNALDQEEKTKLWDGLLETLKVTKKHVTKFSEPLLKKFDQESIAISNELEEGKKVDEHAILQLQANYQTLSPLFLGLDPAETRPIETRYRTVISRSKKANIAEFGSEWQEIVKTLNHPISQDNPKEKYNEKLLLLNDFLQMTYSEAMSESLSSEERHAQIEILKKIIKIILQPKNTTLKRAIELFEENNIAFQRSKNIKTIDLSAIKHITQEQPRIERARAYSKFAALQLETPIEQMEPTAPELVAYMKAIGEACEGVGEIFKNRLHTSNIQKIITRFGEKFVLKYITQSTLENFKASKEQGKR